MKATTTTKSFSVYQLSTGVLFSAILSLVFFFSLECNAATMKTLDELIDVNSSKWESVMRMSTIAKNKIEILPKDSLRATKAIVESQLSTKSFIGSIVYGCGGILVDGGWVRILGSGCSKMNRSLSSWNSGKLFTKEADGSSFMFIADDVLGGFFGIKINNCEDLDACQVYYYGPNSLTWQSTGLSYTGFIAYCFSGDIQDFYSGFRWIGWENDVKNISCDAVVSCFPLLWTKEALTMKTSRKVVPVQRQWDLYHSPHLMAAGKVQ